MLEADATLEWIAGLFPVLPRRTRRASLMFTDLEGFSAHAAARGDRAAVALLRRHDTAALPAIRRHMGRVVKRLGDGLMVVFASPRDAVAAALAMQSGAAQARVRLRIGIHHGEMRTHDGDLVGHDVNVAARIAARAPGGCVLVSAPVRSAAAGLPAVFRQRHALVVAERPPIPLYEVTPPPGSAARRRSP